MRRTNIKTKPMRDQSTGGFCKVFYCNCKECGRLRADNDPRTIFCSESCCRRWHNHEGLARDRADTAMFRKMREARINLELSKETI
jgi:hypothetical protein